MCYFDNDDVRVYTMGKTEPLKAQKINGYFWLVNEFNIGGCRLALLSSYKKLQMLVAIQIVGLEND